MKRQIRIVAKKSSNQGHPAAASAAPKKYYTRKEVAAFAGVCTHTVALDAKQGRIEETRFNSRRIRYRSDRVQAYLEAEFDTTIPVKPTLLPAPAASKSPSEVNPHMSLSDGLDIRNPEVAKAPKSAVFGGETAMPNSQVVDSQQKVQASGADKPIMKFCRSRGENTPVCHFPTPSAECLDSGGRLDGCPFLAIYLILFSRTLPLPASLYLREGSHIKIINN
jgi:hypothetical protein